MTWQLRAPKETLKTSVMALDRALRSYRFWVPQWYNATHRVAYWNMYEHPEEIAPYALGQFDYWWFNAEKAKNFAREVGLNLPIAYGLSIQQIRQLGLYISEPRPNGTDKPFPEPGLFVFNEKGHHILWKF